MMIEPLYDFSLTAEQEARARTLHESSIILDMLFQGPVGTYSLPEGAEEELLALAQEACPGDEIAQCNWATAEILRRMIGGSYSQLYKDCWYDSGLTGGCRQLSVTDRDEALRSAVELQAEFDTYPWLVKCTSVEQIRRCKKEGLKAGIVTSQEAEGYKCNSRQIRSDVLVYDTPVLEQDIAIAGPLYAELYAASSAVDTDFIVRVSDVDEQGTARNVSFNIIRAEFRKGWDKPELLTPGKIEKYEMEMYFYGMVFKKGHKIRIDISSSELMEAFPNTNTGIDPYTDPKPIKATQTIYHGREYPSHVKLPVLYGL